MIDSQLLPSLSRDLIAGVDSTYDGAAALAYHPDRFMLPGFMLVRFAALLLAGAVPDFDRQIAPIIASRCLECHSGAEPKGMLDLSRARTAAAGGESGAGLVAERPHQGQIWQRIDANEMPPKRPLPAAERELLLAWISAGGKWGTDPNALFRYTSAEGSGYDGCALQPLKRFEPPPVGDPKWAGNPIDRFVLHKLEAAGLRPSPEADRRTLIRRLSFDLLGLPPTPEEVD